MPGFHSCRSRLAPRLCLGRSGPNPGTVNGRQWTVDSRTRCASLPTGHLRVHR